MPAAKPDPVMPRPSLVERAPVSFGLFALSRELHGYGAELLLKLGLHPGQELILMRLFDRDGQTQAELQQAVGLDHSTVSRSIRRMEDAGLVARARAEHDRRAFIVSLAAGGEALREPLADLWTTLDRLATETLHRLKGADFLSTVAELERAYATARRG
ncbi:MarR family winged helix-turn-helix transcriptional regulator [Streptomyces sp. GbtcB6]|uniref:MarR family winged helix-turn-helix transcriptional regulator n=1 Tax=Streptomyces sp. GbtcB6 TaxID=2824751 RepID=UPI0020C6E2C6|nr:MarR family transcriptional regulator [Streptomyces sp. GbtcB6]